MDIWLLQSSNNFSAGSFTQPKGSLFTRIPQYREEYLRKEVSWTSRKGLDMLEIQTTCVGPYHRRASRTGKHGMIQEYS